MVFPVFPPLKPDCSLLIPVLGIFGLLILGYDGTQRLNGTEVWIAWIKTTAHRQRLLGHFLLQYMHQRRHEDDLPGVRRFASTHTQRGQSEKVVHKRRLEFSENLFGSSLIAQSSQGSLVSRQFSIKPDPPGFISFSGKFFFPLFAQRPQCRQVFMLCDHAEGIQGDLPDIIMINATEQLKKSYAELSAWKSDLVHLPLQEVHDPSG